MATSRYHNQDIIDNKYFASSDVPSSDFYKIQTFSVRITNADRLDILAAKYLGNGEYWWLIAELNNIDWPFDFEDGQIIKIPVSIEEALKFF